MNAPKKESRNPRDEHLLVLREERIRLEQLHEALVKSNAPVSVMIGNDHLPHAVMMKIKGDILAQILSRLSDIQILSAELKKENA